MVLRIINYTSTRVGEVVDLCHTESNMCVRRYLRTGGRFSNAIGFDKICSYERGCSARATALIGSSTRETVTASRSVFSNAHYTVLSHHTLSTTTWSEPGIFRRCVESRTFDGLHFAAVFYFWIPDEAKDLCLSYNDTFVCFFCFSVGNS